MEKTSLERLVFSYSNQVILAKMLKICYFYYKIVNKSVKRRKE